MKKTIFVLLLVWMLAACAPASSRTIEPAPGLPATRTPFIPVAPTLTETISPSPTATATPQPTPTFTLEPPPTATPEPVIMMGAGDIAACGEEGDEQTAAILERFPNAAIFTTGDNVYDKGKTVEFENCYDPSWGRFKDRTRPSPGNHDYNTDMANPYFAYFGERAGTPGQGYYSYDVGEWHVIALNSNCVEVGCNEVSAQVEWLKADLQASDKTCSLAYWHNPRWSSGLAGNAGWISPFWRVLYEARVEVVVNGHDHNYERFAPQGPDGNPDPNGIRQFVVGTGGAYQRSFGTIKPNSEVRETGTLGVIQFTLYPGRYEWQFLPVEGLTFSDSGSGECH